MSRMISWAAPPPRVSSLIYYRSETKLSAYSYMD